MFSKLLNAIFCAFAQIFTFNEAKPLPPVMRFRENPFVRRVVCRSVGVAESMSRAVSFVLNAFQNLNVSMGRAGVLNVFLEPLPTFEFQAPAVKADLPQSLYIEAIHCVISGQLDVANGAGDGALQTEPVARLIDELRVRWDGYDLFGPINGRDAVALSRRNQSQGVTTQDIAIPGVQAATLFSLPFSINFARQYLSDPFDTVLPPLQVDRELILQVRWNQSRSNANAATTAGSGAIVAGGTRDVTLSDVQMTATVQIARNGKKPLYLPVTSVYETRQISAADPRLVMDIRSLLPFDLAMFRTLEDAAEDAANLIQDITFKSDQVRILDAVPIQTLRMIEEQRFPAIQNATEIGTNAYLFADAGKLGNAVNPAELSNPKYEFNIAVPNNNPGFVRAVVQELLSIPDVTVL